MPRPELQGPDAVLVRVATAALNRLDLFVIGGLPHTDLAWPHILGSDGAGVVEAAGPEAIGFAQGDRVLINPGLSCRTCQACLAGEQPLCREFRILGEHIPGTLAEYVVVPATNLARIPAGIDWPEAAAFTLATLTAWRMVTTRAQVRSGETVLIWGAGGGVAQAAIQIAKRAGARVIATSSTPEKLAMARRLGAEITLNHVTEDVARRVRDLTGTGADVVVDCVGEATWLASLRALRPLGRLVVCGATSGPQVALDLRRLFWFQWTILGSTMGSDMEFRAIVELLGQGELRPIVDAVVPLANAPAAFARLAGGLQMGKLVIEVAS
jgi:NADPH:quinone reductase-like Zn-dependent oxidoreductase